MSPDTPSVSKTERDIANRARKLLSVGKHAAALSQIENLAAQFPGSPGLEALKIEFLQKLMAAAPQTLESGVPNVLVIHARGAVASEMIGHARLLRGQNAGAILAYQQSLAAQPVNPLLNLRLGDMLRESGDLSGALVYYQHAAEQAPGHVPALNNLAALLMDIGDSTRATPLLERAFRLAPDAAPVLCNVGRLERMCTRFEIARARYRRATEVAPGHFDAWIALADIAEHDGQIEESATNLNKAAAIEPQNPQLALIGARIARREGRHHDGLAMLEPAITRDLPEMLRADMHYLMGQLREAVHDVRAFGHFETANNIKLARLKDVATDDYYHAVAMQRAEFEARREVLAGRAPRRADRTPAFLVGFPRSGTTLLEQILDSHPRIQAMPERPAADAMRNRLKELTQTEPGAAVLPEPVLKELEDAYYREVSRHLSLAADRLLVDKMPLNLAHVDLIAPVFPDARFILALRHPCDVVLSCFMQNFTLNLGMRSFLTLEGAADVYTAVMQYWLDVVEALPIKVHTIRYEDLLDNFEVEVRNLLEFLGVGWDESVRGHVEHAKSRRIATPSYHQVTRPLYRTARYRWHRYADHLQPVMGKLAPFVERFGYASTNPEIGSG